MSHNLDQHLEQLNNCLDLMRKYRAMQLTGDLARNFIHELAAIDDSYHAQITEGIDENIELSEVSDAYLILNPHDRYAAIKSELDSSLVYIVNGFIKDKLAEMDE